MENERNTIIKSVPSLKNGHSARVVKIKNDKDIEEQLAAMGIRPNVMVKKVSSSLFRGPVVIEIDFMQVALGFDMASHIFVEVEK